MDKKSLKVALFRCCNTHSCLSQSETVITAVLEHLGIEAIYLKEFNCCGYPLKNISFKAHILSSARNLSIAEKRGLDIITFCSCCYGTLKNVNHLLRTENALRCEINTELASEGLVYSNGVTVFHFLEFCFHRIGLQKMKVGIRKRYTGLKIAAHYGCHLLRPRQIVCFDNHQAPVIFDQLVALTGAQSIQYPNRFRCCGFSICGIDIDLSKNLAQRKISAARQSGADFLCTVCPNCQLQFDRVQKIIVTQKDLKQGLPSISYIQLLGLSLGLDPFFMGLDRQEFDTIS